MIDIGDGLEQWGKSIEKGDIVGIGPFHLHHRYHELLKHNQKENEQLDPQQKE
jgi:hypothetical protein